MVIQVLNSKPGITLRASVTPATIPMAKRTTHKNGLNHGTMTHTVLSRFESKLTCSYKKV